jgi:hypothetical protein
VKSKLVLLVVDAVFRAMSKVSEVMDPFMQILGRLVARASPELLLLSLPTVALAAFMVGIVALIHLLLARMTLRRRARVFISFQHDRESIAERLADAMAELGVSPSKLPFVENPDHDALLDKVRQEISNCNVFVCIPGNRASFVENEVSMAFALGKPLLFISVEADSARIPNTAKKGYPIFVLERVQREGLRTFVNFCSYLAADWRSTVRLYGAVLKHLSVCTVIFLILNMVCLALATYWANDATDVSAAIPKVADADGVLEWGKAIVSDPMTWLQAVLHYPPTVAFVVASLVLYLLTYGAFSITRTILRANVRRVISGKRFRENFLPKTLDGSLTRADLLGILYRGDIRAAHESLIPDLGND